VIFMKINLVYIMDKESKQTQQKSRPKQIRSTEAFNRKILRKTTITLFDNDIFQISSKILDRDTLKVTHVASHYTKQSLSAIVRMYLQDFLEFEEFVRHDWECKSDQSTV